MMPSLKQLVDVEMIPTKLTFFLTDGYYGSIMPFMNVFYRDVGLTVTQAGIISGISMLVSSFFNPLWSALADATGFRRAVFTIMCIGSAVTVFSMPWVEKAVADIDYSSNYTNTKSYKYFQVPSYNSDMSSHGSVLSSNGSHPTPQPHHLKNRQTLFYVMLCLNTVAWIFFTSVRCYVDGIVTNVVNTAVPTRSYGSQRVFSTLGYALLNFLTGVIIDSYHPTGMSSYTACFYVYLPCILGVIPCGILLLGKTKFDDTTQATDEPTTTTNVGVLTVLLSVFKNADFFVFFISVIVSGLTLNIFNCFFFLYMEELGSKKTLMTFTIVVSCVFEVTVFWFAKQIIRLVGGTIPAFIIGIFSFVPRFIFMSYIQNPWLVLISQPLHGLGMGLAWAAAIDHTYASFPSETTVTAIALMSSIEFIGSTAIANIGGGHLYEKYGGKALFRASGIVAGVWCVFMCVYYGCRHKQNKRTNNQQRTVQEVDNKSYEI